MMKGRIGPAGKGSLSVADFFAGSGLVRVGLEPAFETVWANDVCPKKGAIYRANSPEGNFVLSDIDDVRGHSLPPVDLAWASFPCQDLSLAGAQSGLSKGTRSGLFWQWIRILKEICSEERKPPVLCAENVVGFLSAAKSEHFRAAYYALRELGYLAGAVVIDAKWFLPQSRPRAFLVAVREGVDLAGLTCNAPSTPFHTRSVIEASRVVSDLRWIWWSLPQASARVGTFSEMYERDAQCDPTEKTARLLELLSPNHRERLDRALQGGSSLVSTGYRRTRTNRMGRKVQRLELRFDGIAGCLRTPEGGSSRQTVLIVRDGCVRSRLMTVRECARLMGADDTYLLPGSYNDGYRAMGDAVAVPVTRFLSEELLQPLARRRRTLDAA